MYRIFLAVLMLPLFIGSFLEIHAQSNNSKFLLRNRLRDSSWFRYDKGKHVIIPLPLVAAYFGGEDYSIPIGAEIGYGNFLIKQLLIAGSISYENIFVSGPDMQRQYLKFRVKYFFFPQQRCSIYTGADAFILAYQYTPSYGKYGFVFMDDAVDGEKKHHFLPGIQISTGVSIKFLKKMTVQLGVIANYKFTTASGRIPDMKSTAGLDLGLQYHF